MDPLPADKPRVHTESLRRVGRQQFPVTAHQYLIAGILYRSREVLLVCRRRAMSALIVLGGAGTTGCLVRVTSSVSRATLSLSDTKRDIVETYSGHRRFQRGVGEWETGIAAFNDRRYDAAVSDFEAAVERFTAAQVTFGETEEAN